MDDPRNSLFMHYKSLLNEIKPNGFIFENVAGLLNMEKGKVFERVKEEFSSTMKTMNGWILNSEHYAIPQRRKGLYWLVQTTLYFQLNLHKN